MRNFILYIFISFIFFESITIAAASNEISIKIGTGNKTGNYYALGRIIKKAILQKNKNISVEIKQTDGYQENLKLLLEGKVDFIMLQSDIATNAFKSIPYLRGIAVLYPEAMQLIVSKKSTVLDIDDIRGKKISIGSKGSGTFISSRRFLNYCSIYSNQADFYNFSFNKAFNSLERNSIDGAFLVTGAPNNNIASLLRTGKYSLVTLSVDLRNSFVKRNPSFIALDIPANTYGNVPEVHTIGVQALLITKQCAKKEKIEIILEALFSAEVNDSIKKLSGSISHGAASYNLPIDIHPDAWDYHFSHGMYYDIFWMRFLDIMILAAVLFILVLMYLKIIWRQTYYRVLVSMFCLYLVATVIMHLVESRNNIAFSSLGKSFWSTTLYVLSGMESKEPNTLTGKVLAVVLLITNIGIIGTLIGKLTSIFLREKENKIMEKSEQHIIVCNWNSKGDAIIKELHSQQADAMKKTAIIIISPKTIENEEELRQSAHFENVFFIKSDPQLHEVLERSKLEKTRSVIILADESSPDADAKSTLIALAIKKICESKGIPLPHIVAEAVNHKKQQHLRDAGVSEVICQVDFCIGILAQSALHAKLSEIYSDLLHYSDTTNEIYIISHNDKCYPTWIIGKSFAEAAKIISENRDKKNPAILLGAKRSIEGKTELIMNPQNDFVFLENDEVIAMSFSKPYLNF